MLYNYIYIYIYVPYHVILYITEFFFFIWAISNSLTPGVFWPFDVRPWVSPNNTSLTNVDSLPGIIWCRRGAMTVSPSIREVPGNFWLKENHDIPHTLWNWWWWWWWWWWCNLWFILLLHINSLSICLCLYGGFILHPSSSFFAHYYIG